MRNLKGPFGPQAAAESDFRFSKLTLRPPAGAAARTLRAACEEAGVANDPRV